jgi:hypothetical protein
MKIREGGTRMCRIRYTKKVEEKSQLFALKKMAPSYPFYICSTNLAQSFREKEWFQN